LKFLIVRSRGEEHADAPHALALLRARRERPRCRRHSADERDKLAPFQGQYSRGSRQIRGMQHNTLAFDKLVGSEKTRRRKD
jgi:hypothetical protein